MRRTLAAAALLTLPLAALPTPAQAVAASGAVTKLPSTVHLTDVAGDRDDRLAVTVSYTCSDDDDVFPRARWYIWGNLDRQGMTHFEYGQKYSGIDEAKCTGREVTEVLSFRRHGLDTSPGTYLSGDAKLEVGLSFSEMYPYSTIQSTKETITTEVVLPGRAPTAPAKKSVALTANAAPEPIALGKTLTIKGTIKRSGRQYRASTSLQFRRPTGSYKTIKSVTSGAKGTLSATVRATKDGCFRYYFAGNSTTGAGASAGDCVDVLPEPED